MLCVLYIFIDLYTCYIDHLWQDGDLVSNKIGVDRESIVYPLALVLHPPPPLRSRPPLAPLLLSPPILVILHIPKVYYDTQLWVYRARVSALIPPSTFSTSTPTSRRWDPYLTYTWFHTFPYPSQPSSQGAQASSFTPSQDSTNQRVELRYDDKS